MGTDVYRLLNYNHKARAEELVSHTLYELFIIYSSFIKHDLKGSQSIKKSNKTDKKFKRILITDLTSFAAIEFKM